MSVCEDNWDYFIDLNGFENERYKDFEHEFRRINENLLKKIEGGFKETHLVYNGNNMQYHEEELRDFIEKNKTLRHKIETTLEALSSKQNQYKSLKEDQQLLSNEIKERHEAFLMAKKYYKKLLKMYHTIESRHGDEQTIYIQFFTESKKDSNYSVRLLRNTRTGQYLLLDTTPRLPTLKEFQRKLKETNDVPGALCSIRRVFLSMKNKKN